MGVGKTTLAKALSRSSHLAFLDTDEVIEDLAGQSIDEIFAQQGEEAFRTLERQVIAGLADCRDTAIATGGGAPIEPHNLDLLSSLGLVVHLQLPFALILQRLDREGSIRPLAKNREELERLYYARLGIYRKLPFSLDLSGLSVEMAVASLWAMYEEQIF